MRTIIILVKNSLKEILRKKDFYVLLILLFAFVFYLSSISFFQEKGITRYLKEASLQIVWIFSLVIAIPAAAKQIPDELKSFTIYPLLSKPVTRFQFILGKFFAAGLASIFSYTVFCLVFLSCLWFKNSTVDFIVFFQMYYLQCLFLLLISSVGICFSLFLTPSANVSILFLLYFFILGFASRLKAMAEGVFFLKAWVFKALYFILPHFEFFDLRLRFIHDWPGIPFWTILAITGYAVCYISIFLILANAYFRKKVL